MGTSIEFERRKLAELGYKLGSTDTSFTIKNEHGFIIARLFALKDVHEWRVKQTSSSPKKELYNDPS